MQTLYIYTNRKLTTTLKCLVMRELLRVRNYGLGSLRDDPQKYLINTALNMLGCDLPTGKTTAGSNVEDTSALGIRNQSKAVNSLICSNKLIKLGSISQSVFHGTLIPHLMKMSQVKFTMHSIYVTNKNF